MTSATPAADPVVVVAVFTAAPGQRDALRSALVEAIPAVHAEAGCELYAIHDAPDDQIYMLEKWTSVELLDAHGAGPAVARLQELIAGLTAGAPEVVRMTPIPTGTPEQGLLELGAPPSRRSQFGGTWRSDAAGTGACADSAPASPSGAL